MEWKQKVVTRRCCNPPRERRKCSSFSPTFLLSDTRSPSPRGEQREHWHIDNTRIYLYAYVQCGQCVTLFFFSSSNCRIRRDHSIVSRMRGQGVRFSLWSTLLRGMQGEWKFELATRDTPSLTSFFDPFTNFRLRLPSSSYESHFRVSYIYIYIYTVFANIFLREVFSILFFSFHSFWRGRRGEEILKDWDLSVERERVSKMSIVRRCGQEVNGAWMWMYDATKATEKLSTEHSSTLYTRKSRDHSSLVLDVALLLVDEKSCQGLFLYNLKNRFPEITLVIILFLFRFCLLRFFLFKITDIPLPRVCTIYISWFI